MSKSPLATAASYRILGGLDATLLMSGAGCKERKVLSLASLASWAQRYTRARARHVASSPWDVNYVTGVAHGAIRLRDRPIT